MNRIIIDGDQARLYGVPKAIPTGQVGFSKISFEFSPEWDGMTKKIAQFMQGKNSYNVYVENDVCTCPNELVRGWVSVRVRGYSEAAVIATANEIILPVSTGFQSGGMPSIPPTPDLYQKLLKTIQDQIGDLSDLTTEAKDTLVAAINEAAASVTGDSIAAALGYTPTNAWYVTITENGDEYAADKTVQEIKTAYDNGFAVFAKAAFNVLTAVVPLFTCTSDIAIFNGLAWTLGDASQVTVVIQTDSCNVDTTSILTTDKIAQSVDSNTGYPVSDKAVFAALAGSLPLGLTNASVGQIARITTVDESGKPMGWEPVDMPSGGADWAQNDPTAKDYVKNRPFYTAETQIVASKLNFDVSDALSGEAISKFAEAAEDEKPVLLRIGENEVELQPLGFADGYYRFGYGGEKTGCYIYIGGTDRRIRFDSSVMLKALGITENDANKSFDFKIFKRVIVQIPDKYIPHAFFEIKAAATEHPNEDGVFKVTADKSEKDVWGALERGEVPYVNFEDVIFLWLTDYGHGATFVSFTPVPSGISLMAVHIDGENSVGKNFVLPTTDMTGDPANLGTFVKDNLVSAINEVNEKASKSPNAVLYTAQTLTDEQKKQARKNIEAAGSDFVVNITINDDDTQYSVDKTFAQIREAALNGKRVLARITPGTDSTVAFLSLIVFNENSLMFSETGLVENNMGLHYMIVTSTNKVSSGSITAPALNSSGKFPQQIMDVSPTEDMQIATKKYVDDTKLILQSTTADSTKKFKITVDDSGTLSAVEVTE